MQQNGKQVLNLWVVWLGLQYVFVNLSRRLKRTRQVQSLGFTQLANQSQLLRRIRYRAPFKWIAYHHKLFIKMINLTNTYQSQPDRIIIIDFFIFVF